MFIGLDLGTSSLKALLLDREHRVRATASAPLTVQQPQPLWREQHPAGLVGRLRAGAGRFARRTPRPRASAPTRWRRSACPARCTAPR